MNDTKRSTEDWRDLDAAHYLHPFTDYAQLVRERSARVIVRGQGCHIWDHEGRKYLDAFAGLACVALGYGRGELGAAAARQIDRLSYSTSFFKGTNLPAIQLAEKLAQLTPAGLNRVFYGNSGSDANDTAFRLIRHYWNCVGKPNKKTIISREYAYHGSTVASGALSGIPPMHEQGALLPDVVHIKTPYQFRYGRDMTEEAFCLVSAGWLEEEILRCGADKVAAFFVQPIQGAGGFKMPPKNYLIEVERICRKHDVLLVVDEVITGFGRTGSWFASESMGPITPDLLCIAKGITSGYIPLSGVMVHDRIADAIIRDGGEFYHGFTYSGHPVACAVALENLRLMEAESIVDRVANDTGPYFAKRLNDLLASNIVPEVRAVGLIGAVELVANKSDMSAIVDPEHTCEDLREFGYEEGIVIRVVESTLMIAPPLVVSREEIDFVVEKVSVCLRRFEDSLRGK